jgi:hypothetical protein
LVLSMRFKATEFSFVILSYENSELDFIYYWFLFPVTRN